LAKFKSQKKPTIQQKIVPISSKISADLRFVSLQPDTSLLCETMDMGLVHRETCLSAHSFHGCSLLLPTEGWPGWVYLRVWLVPRWFMPVCRVRRYRLKAKPLGIRLEFGVRQTDAKGSTDDSATEHLGDRRLGDKLRRVGDIV